MVFPQYEFEYEKLDFHVEKTVIHKTHIDVSFQMLVFSHSCCMRDQCKQPNVVESAIVHLFHVTNQ